VNETLQHTHAAHRRLVQAPGEAPGTSVEFCEREAAWTAVGAGYMLMLAALRTAPADDVMRACDPGGWRGSWAAATAQLREMVGKVEFAAPRMLLLYVLRSLVQVRVRAFTLTIDFRFSRWASSSLYAV
jgi:hypothetical protein